MDTSSNAAPLRFALRSLAPGGRCTTQLARWNDADEAFLDDTTQVVVFRATAFAPTPPVSAHPTGS